MPIIFNPSDDSPLGRKMDELAEAFFKTESDPTQIPVSLESRARLNALSPYSLCVETDESGSPISWRVTIPTQKHLADSFLKGDITEKEMFDRTAISESYDALYLASSTTVPERRRRGLAKKLLILSLERFMEKYPIELIFAWPYSKEGAELDRAVERATGYKIVFKADS